jgi:probable rRNA maturation factor
MISFFTEEIKFNLPQKLKAKKWLQAVANNYGKKIGDLNYIFCTDDYLLEINKQYLNHDFYTDIITFDQSESDKIIDGEIYISIDRVVENASTIKVNFEDELNRVLVHGVLHLIGFKDKTKEEEQTMRLLENEMLLLLKQN